MIAPEGDAGGCEEGPAMKRLSIAGIIACSLVGLLSAAIVHAATLSGTADCSLEARSYSNTGTWEASPGGPVPAGGTVLDEGRIENGFSPEGTESDPFDVAWDGRVDFRFQTGVDVFQNNRWEIYAMGLPVPILSGSDDNPSDLDELGYVEIGNQAPGLPRFVGMVHVTGWLEGNSGTSRCDGEGWVRIVGDPVGTVPWIVMAGLILLGLVFLVATPYTLTWEEGALTPWEQHAPGPRPEN